MGNLTHDVEFQSKLDATKTSDYTALLIKVLSLIPGILFAIFFIAAILMAPVKNEPSQSPALIIAMNLLFVALLLVKKVRHESFDPKQNIYQGIAVVSEIIWFIAMVKLI